jgi:hypothetical protein
MVDDLGMGKAKRKGKGGEKFRGLLGNSRFAAREAAQRGPARIHYGVPSF